MDLPALSIGTAKGRLRVGMICQLSCDYCADRPVRTNRNSESSAEKLLRLNKCAGWFLLDERNGMCWAANRPLDDVSASFGVLGRHVCVRVCSTHLTRALLFLCGVEN